MFKNILTITLVISNTIVILALAISTGVAMTAVNEKREIQLLAPDTTSKVLYE